MTSDQIDERLNEIEKRVGPLNTLVVWQDFQFLFNLVDDLRNEREEIMAMYRGVSDRLRKLEDS